MQDVITDVIARRRDRAIAVLLGVKEKEVDSYLPPHVRARLRKVILDQMNDFHSLVVDVMRSLDTGEVVLNELYMEKIDDLHRDVRVIHNQILARNGDS
jgi:hypothetical protein